MRHRWAEPLILAPPTPNPPHPPDFATGIDRPLERGLPERREGRPRDDNLNTHNIPGVCGQGLRPGQQAEIHHTPNTDPSVAEIELSCLTKQCLGRRINDLDVLNQELDAWTQATNADRRQVDWRFTTSDARIKLRHLYPAL